jgi:hypothetical protein
MWENYIIGYAQAVGLTSPQPVAPPVAIQPLDQQYPMQIIVPAAIGPGTLQVQLFEMYNNKVWDEIMLVTDLTHTDALGEKPNSIYNDLSEIFLRLSALAKPVTAQKYIYPPNAGVHPNPTNNVLGNQNAYCDVYYNCMITDIRDDENIQIGSMEIVKNITIQFTNTIRKFYSHANNLNFSG